MKKISLILILIIVVALFASCSEIDRSELKSALENVYSEDDYLSDAYALYKEKYDEAQRVMDDEGANELQIKQAAEDLMSAVENLRNNKKADFSVLEAALAEVYNKEDYLPETYSEYEEAYKMAKNIFDNKDSRQSTVNSAVKYLRDKINALVKKSDTTALEELLNNKRNKDLYTPSSYEKYQAVYDEALSVFNDSQNPDYTGDGKDLQIYVDLCTQQLQKAIDALVMRANTEELSEVCVQAISVLNTPVNGVAPMIYYTEESYNALSSAIDTVKLAMDDPELDQAKCDTLCSDLRTAIAGMKASDYKGEIEELIATAQSNYLAHPEWYTVASYIALNTAVNKAIDECESPNSTKASLDNAKVRIENAIKGLVYVTDIGTGKTDFDFSQTEVSIAGYVTTVPLLFSEREAFVDALVNDNLMVIGLAADRKTFRLADGSILELTDYSVRIYRNAEITEGVECCSTVHGLDLQTLPAMIVNTMDGMNPTDYVSEGEGKLYIYTDGERGYSINIHHSTDEGAVDDITVIFNEDN